MRVTIFGVLTLALMACGNRNNFECANDSSCNLSGGGKCVAAPSGNNWCAYPDPACPGGFRYSDQDVGDGLAGECVAGSDKDAGIDAPTDARPDSPPVVPGSWGKQIPGAGFESVGAVAIAPDGSVFFAGSFDGTLDIGGGRAPS